MNYFTYEEAIVALRAGHHFISSNDEYLHNCGPHICLNCPFSHKVQLTRFGCAAVNEAGRRAIKQETLQQVQQNHPEYFI